MANPPERDRVALASVDDALRTYPLAEAPTGLKPRVLARIRRLAPQPRPVFQIRWLDYALSLFAAGMAALFFLTLRLVPASSLYPLWMRLQLEALLISRQVNLYWVVPALGLSALLLLAALLAAAWQLTRPRPGLEA